MPVNPLQLGQLARMVQTPDGLQQAAQILAANGARPPAVEGAPVGPIAPASPNPAQAGTTLPASLPESTSAPAATNPAASILGSPVVAALAQNAGGQQLPFAPPGAPAAVNPGGATGPAAVPAINDALMQLLLGQGGAGAGQPLNLGQLIRGA